MKYSKWNNKALGFVFGLIGPVIGFFLLYVIRFSFKEFNEYWRMFLEVDQMKSPIMSLTLIMNIILLFLMLKKDLYKTGWGILFATFCYVPFIVYFFVMYRMGS